MPEFDETPASNPTVIDLRWGQSDPAPYLVPVPRVPCVGEMIVGHDAAERVVTNVTYLYEHGFYFLPVIIVETDPLG